MPIDFSTNLVGRVNVIDFSISIGISSLSADFQKVIIPFTGTANPAQTSSVNIVSYEYSIDNGSTWNSMTLDSAESDTDNLTFDTDGEEYSLTWQAKTDIGTQIYNNSIQIRLNAQATFGSDTVTVVKMTLVSFPRSVSNQAKVGSSSPFPEDYSGILGEKLLTNAPRQQG